MSLHGGHRKDGRGSFLRRGWKKALTAYRRALWLTLFWLHYTYITINDRGRYMYSLRVQGRDDRGCAPSPRREQPLAYLTRAFIPSRFSCQSYARDEIVVVS